MSCVAGGGVHGRPPDDPVEASLSTSRSTRNPGARHVDTQAGGIPRLPTNVRALVPDKDRMVRKVPATVPDTRLLSLSSDRRGSVRATFRVLEEHDNLASAR